MRDLDYVIGNEHEWESLYQTDLASGAGTGGRRLRPDRLHPLGSRRGDPQGGETAVVPVQRVVPVDATGAGDLFAAGFLYGIVTGQSLMTCGQMGCAAAAEVISHFGARPEADLLTLFRDKGLI